MEEEAGIYRGEVEAIMLSLTYLNEKLDTILRYIEGDEDVDGEATDPPYA